MNIKKVIDDFEFAATERASKGCMPPEAWAEIDQAYDKAREKLEEALQEARPVRLTVKQRELLYRCSKAPVQTTDTYLPTAALVENALVKIERTSGSTVRLTITPKGRSLVI